MAIFAFVAICQGSAIIASCVDVGVANLKGGPPPSEKLSRLPALAGLGKPSKPRKAVAEGSIREQQKPQQAQQARKAVASLS